MVFQNREVDADYLCWVGGMERVSLRRGRCWIGIFHYFVHKDITAYEEIAIKRCKGTYSAYHIEVGKWRMLGI